ncbi:MAG TPA: amino acid permease [Solirubrobacteraceae bacterium]
MTQGEQPDTGTSGDVPGADSHHAHHRAAELSESARTTLRHSLGSPILFAVVYTSLASAVFFSLGVVADHALGLTPVVFLIAAVMFGVTAMTYLEGASLHPEPGGSTVFARYAFNELTSFIAGWAMLLDYVILIAVTAFAATQYMAVFWAPLGHSGEALLLSIAIIAFVVLTSIRGFNWRREYRIGLVVVGALALELVAIAIGLDQFFNAHTLVSQVHLGSAPTWSGLIFALTVTTIAFTSVESASGLAGEVKAGRGSLRRLIASGTATVVIAYVGVAVVAVTALPLLSANNPRHDFTDAPVVDILRVLHPHLLSQVLVYVIGGVAVVTLVAAADSAMLGLSRLAYSLSTNRQIPSGLGRLHPQRSTPYVLILLAGLLACVLVIPESLDFLIGIYAFGAMLAFTIAHVSVVKMRYSEPLSDRPYRTPFSVRLRGGDLPLLAVFGALACSAGWIATMIVHEPARYVGLGWMLAGIVLYVIYRRADETSLLRRVTVPAEALRVTPSPEREYGSILVPLTGTPLDEDIVQTAALLAAGEPTEDELDGSTIEAVWIFEMPMSLPLDARLPDAQVKHARQALARAKAVGEEYAGVRVATATIRARRAGQAILEEARRRGVEAIVLGAEEPSRIRGGSRFGGRGGPMENFVGEATKQVIAKARCRVIVTAPAARDTGAPNGDTPASHGAGEPVATEPVANPPIV